MRNKYLFELVQLIRNYFREQGFLDVLTPPAVQNPGMEVHIHPYQLQSVRKDTLVPLYLHTSPEFHMKELLAEGYRKIFTVSYCFRDEPSSPIHREQFLMLEWYRSGERYETIMEDVKGLINYLIGHDHNLPPRKSIKNSKLTIKTMQEIFFEELKVDILNYLTISSLKQLLHQFPDVPVPKADLEWDDYFFLLYLNKVEPLLKKYPLLMITEFPAPLSALSTLKASDPRVCERFEVYINGVELCNCFNELTDSIEQKLRFKSQSQLKKKLYNYELPEPERFYTVLEKGFPPSAGIAMGVERLLYSLFEIENPFYD
jgi:lysyl-tRNA synthetase class 2